MQTNYIHKPSRSIADLVYLDELSGYLITRINVPKKFRGIGIGSFLLKQIISDANMERVNLYLEISPSDGLNYTQLKAWYIHYGFAW